MHTTEQIKKVPFRLSSPDFLAIKSAASQETRRRAVRLEVNLWAWDDCESYNMILRDAAEKRGERPDVPDTPELLSVALMRNVEMEVLADDPCEAIELDVAVAVGRHAELIDWLRPRFEKGVLVSINGKAVTR